MSEGPLLPLWGVIIGLALIIINAWFAAARKSISESNKTKLRDMAEDGNSRAKAVLPVLDNAPVSKLSTRVLNVIIYMLYCLSCMFFLAMPLYRKLFFISLHTVELPENYIPEICFSSILCKKEIF